MEYVLPDLCDEYPGLVRVVAPMFRNFGGRSSFGGPITTIKCHEDNSLVAKAVEEPGESRVLVVDGGGSMRCGLLGDNLALKAANNGWAGIIVYGCVRDVDELARTDLGIQALNAMPLKSIKKDIGLRDETVTFGGVSFVPGEYAYADNNGVLVSSELLVMPE
ncbi:MAG: ribonuclease E activity regulator RraA [Gammaproteobacteria bacterium]|jgi:regulator of ribonuclease activity A|nr:ribonuclease E activity regulator RraA [Gammaproteobacteria bacterium]MBT4492470.1 ribonuclease E activity regulator RraA [Gammaproteobacteria bacterium]MBT7371168.1 ribonuclease E activity regulator RraA [Gammaproteobacteria bacterium]